MNKWIPLGITNIKFHIKSNINCRNCSKFKFYQILLLKFLTHCQLLLVIIERECAYLLCSLNCECITFFNIPLSSFLAALCIALITFHSFVRHTLLPFNSHFRNRCFGRFALKEISYFKNGKNSCHLNLALLFLCNYVEDVKF